MLEGCGPRASSRSPAGRRRSGTRPTASACGGPGLQVLYWRGDGDQCGRTAHVHDLDGPLAYTAQEHFRGTVADRRGGFAAQHGATPADADQPGPCLLLAGTGGPAGITGTAILVVTDGYHRLTLDYEIPPSP